MGIQDALCLKLPSFKKNNCHSGTNRQWHCHIGISRYTCQLNINRACAITWIRSANSTPRLSYFWAMDITKRMLLIVNISLARNDSRILARSSGADIRSDCASCLYDGSFPSFSFSLDQKLGTEAKQNRNSLVNYSMAIFVLDKTSYHTHWLQYAQFSFRLFALSCY